MAQRIESGSERAILVGVELPRQPSWAAEESLNELERLALTAGAQVVARLIQQRPRPDARTFIGMGKAREVADVGRSVAADLVLFDSELTPSQQHNLESIIPAKVLDRTALILDIFAQHAHSSEGKLQVELAQLAYLLPRLTGKGTMLSRLGGGIGTRGPGETKLEMDRRRIRGRIQHLRKALAEVRRARAVQRKKRRESATFSVSIVGYTNTGKSTVLNALTNAGVLVEDKLFATLDSTARRLSVLNHEPIVLSDTVGFIRGLPHQLIAAFRSTLDEVRDASLLLHVIDAASSQMAEEVEAVDVVLDELGASAKPRLLVFNKIDLLQDQELARLRRLYPEGVFISALTGKDLESLVARIEEAYNTGLVRVSLLIPFSKGEVLNRLHTRSRVVRQRHSAQGTTVVADIPESELPAMRAYLRTG